MLRNDLARDAQAVGHILCHLSLPVAQSKRGIFALGLDLGRRLVAACGFRAPDHVADAGDLVKVAFDLPTGVQQAFQRLHHVQDRQEVDAAFQPLLFGKLHPVRYRDKLVFARVIQQVGDLGKLRIIDARDPDRPGDVANALRQFVQLLGLGAVFLVVRHRHQGAIGQGRIERPRRREEVAQLQRIGAAVQYFVVALRQPVHLARRDIPHLINLGAGKDRADFFGSVRVTLPVWLPFQRNVVEPGAEPLATFFQGHTNPARNPRHAFPVGRRRMQEIFAPHEVPADFLRLDALALLLGILGDLPGFAGLSLIPRPKHATPIQQIIVTHLLQLAIQLPNLGRLFNAPSQDHGSRAPHWIAVGILARDHGNRWPGIDRGLQRLDVGPQDAECDIPASRVLLTAPVNAFDLVAALPPIEAVKPRLIELRKPPCCRRGEIRWLLDLLREVAGAVAHSVSASRGTSCCATCPRIASMIGAAHSHGALDTAAQIPCTMPAGNVSV